MDLRGLRVDSFQCRNHPEREGVGICVACRRVFCVECSTKIDGVNHCRECLAKKQLTAQASTKKRSGLFVRLAELGFSASVIAASFVCVFGIFVLIGEANAKGGGRRVANKDRMEAVARALRSYKRDTGVFPTMDEGLGALVTAPEGVANWHGPYVETSFVSAEGAVVDAFSMAVQFRPPRPGETVCILASGGGDRRLETDLATVARLKFSPGGEGAGEGDDLIFFVE